MINTIAEKLLYESEKECAKKNNMFKTCLEDPQLKRCNYWREDVVITAIIKALEIK